MEKEGGVYNYINSNIVKNAISKSLFNTKSSKVEFIT